MMEDGMPDVDGRKDDEVQETTTILISLNEFGIKEFGDDQVSITAEDYDAFLLDLQDVPETEFPAFVTQQIHAKLRT